MSKLSLLIATILASSSALAQNGAITAPHAANVKVLADGTRTADTSNLPNTGDVYTAGTRRLSLSSSGIVKPSEINASMRLPAPSELVKITPKVGDRVIPSYTVFDEADRSVQTRKTIAALGQNIFGEQVNLYNGQLSFSVTDVSLPGNNSLPVAFTRTYTARNNKGYKRDDWAMGDWKIDLPNINTTSIYTWPAYQGKKRCSDTGMESVIPPMLVSNPPVPDPFISGYNATYTVLPNQYWHGIHADMPGGGEMLVANNATAKPSGGPYRWSTKEQTFFSCIDSIQNPGTDGLGGEGFMAVTADGTKYTFDWMASNLDTTQQYWSGYSRPKIIFTLYPTKIVDRHGNWVEYTYTNAKEFPIKLTQIRSSDNRTLTINYRANAKPEIKLHYVSSVSDGTRTWTYDYARIDTGYPSLKKVTLPDGTSWDISFAGNLTGLSDAVLDYTNKEPDELARTCSDPALFLITNRYYYGNVKHPSGAQGTFMVLPHKFGRSGVPSDCYSNAAFFPQVPNYLNASNFKENRNPVRYGALTMWVKQTQGPGINPDITTYTYSDEAGKIGFATTSPNCQSESCAGRNYTEVVYTGGDKQKFTFGSGFAYDEGKLLRTETGKIENSVFNVLKTETNTYDFAHTGTPYPSPFALSPQRVLVSTYASENTLPLKAKTVTQDGVSFNSIVNGFDSFARPTSVTKASALGVSKTDAITYRDDLNKWILGQVETVSTRITGDVTSIKEVSRTVYDNNSGLPLQTYSFGALQASTTYNPDGTIATVKDANNYSYALSDYKRGMPQLITYPDISSEKAEVNSFGWVTSTTDERNNKTTYEYDVMGRITKITPPTGDSVAWNFTTQSFGKLTADTYNLPIGAWKQTLSQGNYRKETYFDALWQPVLLREYDNTKIAETERFTRMKYDNAGRTIFTSYPGKIHSLTLGTNTEYDALGRVTKIKQDSELGVEPLVTTNEYLPGFEVKTTNPKNFSTITSFMAWDSPSYDLPTSIESPEDVATIFTRDIFGKPLSVTRTGVTNSALSNTRSYVYDLNQRLCLRKEPESGTLMFNYDAVGNLIWSGKGPSSLNACTKLMPADAIVQTYDQLNRIKTVDVPNSTNDLAYNYLPGGLLQNVSNGGVLWEYTYNKLALPVTEKLSFEGRIKTISHRYNANAVEDVLTYPNGLAVDYAPNALGQVTQAARPGATLATDKFATGVTYRSNGLSDGFIYGNNVIHKQLPNLRGLPALRSDIFNNAPIFSEAAAFDANGNVQCVSDGSSGSGADREMTYDGLDRLTSTTMPNSWWINTTTNYDVLDNITKHTVGNRQHTYVYDANQRLSKITRPFGSSGPLSTTNSGMTVKTLASCVSHPLPTDIGVAPADPDPTDPDPTDPGGPGGPGSGQQSISFGEKTTPSKLSPLGARFSAWLSGRKAAKTASRNKPGVKADTCCQTPEQPITVYQFGYDSNGNTISGRHPAVFDAANRLVEITGKEKYTYDGFGRRVKTQRVSDGKINYSIYSSNGQLTTEEDARSNKKIDYIYLNGNLVAQRSATLTGTTYTNSYLHTDSLGSPVAQSNQSGTVTKVERYTPYGEPNDLSYDQGPGFTGHVTDSLTGLTYAQQRYYDPIVGRFISVDSMETDPNTGEGFNRYWYANNNPYKFVDPDGRQACDEVCQEIATHQRNSKSVRLQNNINFGQEVVAKGVETADEEAMNGWNWIPGFTFAKAEFRGARAASSGFSLTNLWNKIKGHSGFGAKTLSRLPSSRTALHSDLVTKGFAYKSLSKQGYVTYKHADGRIVTIKPTGEVIPTSPAISQAGKKYNQRTDYEFNRLNDQSHSTNHFVEPWKGF